MPQTVGENGETKEGPTKDAMQIDVPSQFATALQSKFEESLENRKLAYVHLANDAQPRSQSSVSSFYILWHIWLNVTVFLPLP